MLENPCTKTQLQNHQVCVRLFLHISDNFPYLGLVHFLIPTQIKSISAPDFTSVTNAFIQPSHNDPIKNQNVELWFFLPNKYAESKQLRF